MRESQMELAKIISGGQTGTDRGALDAALAWGFPCGGWCPPGRLAEDGQIPERYPLIELKEGGYSQRTLRNVVESDGTAILYFSQIEAEQRRHSCFASKSTSLTSLLTQRRSPLNARRSYSSRSYSIMALRCLMWQARGK